MTLHRRQIMSYSQLDASYLVFPTATVTEPSGAPNDSVMSLYWSSARPSIRSCVSVRAPRMNVFSTLEMSIARGMLADLQHSSNFIYSVLERF